MDINAKCNVSQAPLFDALHYLETKDVFEELIANGADTNVKTPDGHSLLHYAVMIDKYDFVKILMQRRSKMKIQKGESKILKE